MESDDNPYYPVNLWEFSGPMSGSVYGTSVSGELVFVTLQTVKGNYFVY